MKNKIYINKEIVELAEKSNNYVLATTVKKWLKEKDNGLLVEGLLYHRAEIRYSKTREEALCHRELAKVCLNKIIGYEGLKEREKRQLEFFENENNIIGVLR